MCTIIGDVHKFIGHCLKPLDPCEKELFNVSLKLNFTNLLNRISLYFFCFNLIIKERNLIHYL